MATGRHVTEAARLHAAPTSEANPLMPISALGARRGFSASGSTTIGLDPFGEVAVSHEIQELQAKLREFAKARDWEQFHSPKNLACALSVEVSELLEHFQWLTDEQSRALGPQTHDKVAEELADVLLYALQLADKLSIDPLEAARRKLSVNELKYPADRARGKSAKYTEL